MTDNQREQRIDILAIQLIINVFVLIGSVLLSIISELIDLIEPATATGVMVGVSIPILILVVQIHSLQVKQENQK